MNTVLTILLYFGVGSLLAFIIGLAIQTIQSRSNQDKSKPSHRKRKGEKFNKQAK